MGLVPQTACIATKSMTAVSSRLAPGVAVCSCPANVSRDSVYGTQASICMTQHNCTAAFQPLTLLDLSRHSMRSSVRSVCLLLYKLHYLLAVNTAADFSARVAPGPSRIPRPGL